MNKNLVFRVAIVFLLLFPACLFAQEFKYESLVGKWHTNKKHSSGAMISVDLQINPDKTFLGKMFANGHLIWSYGGQVKFNGKELKWIYKESSKQLPPNYKDIDMIITVDSDKYTYTSGMTGQDGLYYRIK